MWEKLLEEASRQASEPGSENIPEQDPAGSPPGGGRWEERLGVLMLALCGERVERDLLGKAPWRW